jgi:hypothetical protein
LPDGVETQKAGPERKPPGNGKDRPASPAAAPLPATPASTPVQARKT